MSTLLSPSLRLAALLGACALLAGCDASVKIDPEGYRCDVGNSCPAGYGCKDGFCRASVSVDPSCDGVTCTTPPASACTNATTVRTFAGRCVAGQCQYEPVDSTCSTSCADGACVDACSGVACTTPPAPACTGDKTLRTFAQAGTCTMGSCAYQATDTTCPNGCADGNCKGVDLCAGVACTMPPTATCVNGARRTFAAMGTCAAGACSYAPSDMPCANGCELGQCLTASLAFAQTGPRVRFAINGLDVAPGSSGSTALAVGDQGKLARWDGAMWTNVPTNTTQHLNRVAFVSGNVAYAVGALSTALLVRTTGPDPVSLVTLSGPNSANLVAVSGRGEGEVLIASETGDWWRLLSGSWSNGSLPGTNGPWRVTAAYLDESLRERVVGACGTTQGQCVGYRFPTAGTPNYVVHTQSGAPSLAAVGGGFDVPLASAASTAIVGLSDNGLATHSNTGNFGTVAPTPALSGAGVVGVTAQAVALGRDVFVLTSSKDLSASLPGKGGLFRLSRSTTQVSSAEVLETYFGEERLSPNDANGVLVAEVRRGPAVNNIFRRGTITNEALDVGEDLVGASLDDLGGLALVSKYGDVITRRPMANTFDFRRPPTDWAITAFEARHGTGLLMVGADSTGMNGVVVRVSLSGFNTLTTRTGAVFNAVCRVSDSEGWAVGDAGIIYRLTSTTATAVTSPTTRDLLTVDCAPGVAIAAGKDGTVLRFANGAWSPVTPAFPRAGAIVSARLVTGGAFVAGADFFYGFSTTTNAWIQLAARTGLRALVVRGPQEVYGAFALSAGSELRRFNGASWGPSLLQVSGVLGGGVQAGARVVWGGTLGTIVEGR